MANEKNLIANSERTPSELREMTQKGGKKSGESRREKKAQKDRLKMILELSPNMDIFLEKESNRKNFDMLGITKEDIADVETLTDLMTVLSALKGDLNSKKYIDERTGKSPQLKLKREELALKKRELKLKEKSMPQSESEKNKAVNVIDDL